MFIPQNWSQIHKISCISQQLEEGEIKFQIASRNPKIPHES
jgi:hypothetical protein